MKDYNSLEKEVEKDSQYLKDMTLPDLTSNKKSKEPRLTLCLIFLISTLLSIGAYFFRDAITTFNNEHFTLRLVLTIVFGILILIAALIFACVPKLRWDYSPLLKYAFIIFNILSLTLIFYLTLPLIMENYSNWIWAFVCPILVTTFKILNILFIKNNWRAIILRWVSIFLIGVIPLVCGIILKQNTLILGGSWVLIWEVGNEIWDLYFIQFIFRNKNRRMPYYPLFPIVIMALIMIWVLWFVAILVADYLPFSTNWMPRSPFRNREEE